MGSNIKNMVEKLIKEDVDIDVILKSSGLSIKDIKDICPAAYGRYLGAKKQLIKIAKRMLRLGYKKSQILEVTGLFPSKINMLEDGVQSKVKEKE